MIRRLVRRLPIRRGPGSIYRRLESLRFLATRDRQAVLRFLAGARAVPYPLRWRLSLVAEFIHITNEVRAYHTQAELLTVAEAILRRSRPTVVECGTAKGASAAKLSRVVAAAGGHLHVFDSFVGIPDNDEVHRHLDGRRIVFKKGAFTGRLRSVQRVVARYGCPEVCTFHKGWFEATLPKFSASIDVALLDVDLLSSTKTCLVHLVPQLAPNGVIFTQDGHLEAIVTLLEDEAFWREEVGVEPPLIEGLGADKLLMLRF